MTIAAALLVTVALSSHDTFSDRLAEVSDILAGGTLLLALLAGLVALQAFASATGLPQLQLQILLGTSDLNELMFHVDGRETKKFEVERRATDLDSVTTYSNNITGSIILANRNAYSARNPSIIIEFNGIGVLDSSYSANIGWSITEHNLIGISRLQWDADPASSIHGYSDRRLSFNLGTVAWKRVMGESQAAAQQRMVNMKEPSATFILLAEGYRRSITVPVDFYADDEQSSQFPWRGPDTPEWL